MKIPFDIELAKLITNKKAEGKIVTREGNDVRILCFDRKNNTYSIIALVSEYNTEQFRSYTVKGEYAINQETKRDLFIELPDYNFNNGDIITYIDPYSENKVIAIIDNVSYKDYKPVIKQHISYIPSDDCISLVDTGIGHSLKKASESEINLLKNALKNSILETVKEYYTKFFCVNFKPFEKVLVRQNDSENWNISLFSYKYDFIYYTINGSQFLQCIPYNEETKHLLGTNKSL